MTMESLATGKEGLLTTKKSFVTTEQSLATIKEGFATSQQYSLPLKESLAKTEESLTQLSRVLRHLLDQMCKTFSLSLLVRLGTSQQLHGKREGGGLVHFEFA